jgi:hypothetical protein
MPFAGSRSIPALGILCEVDMETIKSFIEFLNSYPLWAKLFAFSGLLITVGTLIFAPRTITEKDNGNAKVFLKIQRVKLFPSDPNAEIQVYAFVNGTKYQYPSVADIEWLKVGPSMSPGIFEIPRSDTYEVRFEAMLRGSVPVRLVSQEVLQISELPYSDEYGLHKTEMTTRDASVSASVRFSMEKSF